MYVNRRAADLRNILGGMGRNGDREVAHLTPGEIVIPKGVVTPRFMTQLLAAFDQAGVPPARYTVGAANSMNPATGFPEYWDANDAESGGFGFGGGEGSHEEDPYGGGEADGGGWSGGAGWYDQSQGIQIGPDPVETIDVGPSITEQAIDVPQGDYSSPPDGASSAWGAEPDSQSSYDTGLFNTGILAGPMNVADKNRSLTGFKSTDTAIRYGAPILGGLVAGPIGAAVARLGAGLATGVGFGEALGGAAGGMLGSGGGLATSFLGGKVGQWAGRGLDLQLALTGPGAEQGGFPSMDGGGEGSDPEDMPAVPEAPKSYVRPEPPPLLSLNPEMTDLQRRAQIATYGLHGDDGMYRTDEVEKYYRDLLAHNIANGTTEFLPIEIEYLRQMLGFADPPDAQTLLGMLG